jgi:hypothetical protein
MRDQDADSAAAETATVDVWVDYDQYYLTDIEDSSQAFERPPVAPGGLTETIPGFVVVYSGTNIGPVRVTVQVHQAAPPLDLVAWEDVTEISFTAPNGQTTIQEWGGQVPQELPNLTPGGPGSYRLRLHVRGRDRGREQVSPEEPVEQHLLAIWPAPPAPNVIHQLTSQDGQAQAGRAAQAAEQPARSATADPAFEPPPATTPQDRRVRTTATTAVESTTEPHDPPDDQPPQQQRNP